MKIWLLVLIGLSADYVGQQCTNTNQCGIGEMCLIDKTNTWIGHCVKVK